MLPMTKPCPPKGLKRHFRVASIILLLCLCLSGMTACSGEVYDPTPGSLSIKDGEESGQNTLELPTEPTTGGVLVIPVTDPFEGSPHVLRADFLNTGESDAMLLRLDDTVILVDTGETDDYSVISHKLTEYGITTIDHLILSHFDNDHIGSVSPILRNYTVKNVYMPEYVRASKLYRTMMETINACEDVTVHRLTEDLHIELPYGRLWINPTALYEAGMTLGSDDAHTVEENNFSLITSVYFGEISLLLAGDAEQDRLKEFLTVLGEEDIYQLIKIPHHGGYDKALGDLLRRCTGLRYCIVHAGSSSLVEASLVTAIRASGAAAKYTYDGEVSFATDGVTMVVYQKG